MSLLPKGATVAQSAESWVCKEKVADLNQGSGDTILFIYCLMPVPSLSIGQGIDL